MANGWAKFLGFARRWEKAYRWLGVMGVIDQKIRGLASLSAEACFGGTSTSLPLQRSGIQHSA